MQDTSQIWWREITGPRSFILSVAERLQEASLIVRVPDDLPWRHEMRREIESELREQYDYADISVIAIDAEEEVDAGEDVASYILNRFALGDVARQYRKKSGKSITQYIVEKQVLKKNILWIKGIGREAVPKWLEFVCAYHACTPQNGRVVLEVRDDIPYRRPDAVEEIKYSSLVSEYHLQLFCSILMDRMEDYSEDWKRYVSTLAAHLCETDAEIAEYYIRSFEHNQMEPHEILSDIAQDAEYSRRGASASSRHVLSLVRSGETPKLQKRIWEAQLQTLFPIVESIRVTLIDRIKDDLTHYIETQGLEQFGEPIASVYDVEWGLLSHLAWRQDSDYEYYLKTLTRADRAMIQKMRDLRNNLAHGNSCEISQVVHLLSEK